MTSQVAVGHGVRRRATWSRVQYMIGVPAGWFSAEELADLPMFEDTLLLARLVAEGLTNKAVSSKLTVSRHTVDSPLRRSFAKMSVASRVELTRCFLTGDQVT